MVVKVSDILNGQQELKAMSEAKESSYIFSKAESDDICRIYGILTNKYGDELKKGGEWNREKINAVYARVSTKIKELLKKQGVEPATIMAENQEAIDYFVIPKSYSDNERLRKAQLTTKLIDLNSDNPIGVYATALRALENPTLDDSWTHDQYSFLVEDSNEPAKKEYLLRNNLRIPVRIFFALYMLAALDDNMQVYSENTKNLKQAETEEKATSFYSLVSTIAEIHRAHNGDPFIYTIYTLPDIPSCTGGAVGRLYKKGSIVNHLTTKAPNSITLIPGYIREYLNERISAFAHIDKGALALWFNHKMLFEDPTDKEISVYNNLKRILTFNHFSEYLRNKNYALWRETNQSLVEQLLEHAIHGLNCEEDYYTDSDESVINANFVNTLIGKFERFSELVELFQEFSRKIWIIKIELARWEIFLKNEMQRQAIVNQFYSDNWAEKKYFLKKHHLKMQGVQLRLQELLTECESISDRFNSPQNELNRQKDLKKTINQRIGEIGDSLGSLIEKISPKEANQKEKTTRDFIDIIKNNITRIVSEKYSNGDYVDDERELQRYFEIYLGYKCNPDMKYYKVIFQPIAALTELKDTVKPQLIDPHCKDFFTKVIEQYIIKIPQKSWDTSFWPWWDYIFKNHQPFIEKHDVNINHSDNRNEEKKASQQVNKVVADSYSCIDQTPERIDPPRNNLKEIFRPNEPAVELKEYDQATIQYVRQSQPVPIRKTDPDLKSFFEAYSEKDFLSLMIKKFPELKNTPQFLYSIIYFLPYHLTFGKAWNREETENALKNKEPNTFCLRIGGSKDGFIWSKSTGSSVQHYIILKEPGKGFHLPRGASNEKYYPTIAVLIQTESGNYCKIPIEGSDEYRRGVDLLESLRKRLKLPHQDQIHLNLTPAEELGWNLIYSSLIHTNQCDAILKSIDSFRGKYKNKPTLFKFYINQAISLAIKISLDNVILNSVPPFQFPKKDTNQSGNIDKNSLDLAFQTLSAEFRKIFDEQITNLQKIYPSDQLEFILNHVIVAPEEKNDDPEQNSNRSYYTYEPLIKMNLTDGILNSGILTHFEEIQGLLKCINNLAENSFTISLSPDKSKLTYQILGISQEERNKLLEFASNQQLPCNLRTSSDVFECYSKLEYAIQESISSNQFTFFNSKDVEVSAMDYLKTFAKENNLISSIQEVTFNGKTRILVNTKETVPAKREIEKLFKEICGEQHFENIPRHYQFYINLTSDELADQINKNKLITISNKM